MDEIISIEQVTKIHKTENVLTYAVNDVSLRVHAGESLAIVGPSGSGKSTLLSLLGILDRPTRGEVRIERKATASLPARARARLRNQTFAYVFQNFSLIPQLTAIDNVALPLVYRDVDAREREARAMEALEHVDLAHRAQHLPSQLSGGEQQRLAIARALVSRPRAVLADEPTGNLDSENAANIVALLLGMACANMAGLLFTETMRRMTELGLRGGRDFRNLRLCPRVPAAGSPDSCPPFIRGFAS